MPTIIYCHHCGDQITSKYAKKFCNASCAAKHNNVHRAPCKHGPEKTIFPFSPVTFLNCRTCSKPFRVPNIGNKYCTAKCKKYNSKKAYRNDCKFNLNKRDHPELFNGPMITEYGWYQPATAPKPNQEGVTWDHLYRCSDGYDNNVPADIMRHPANAEMIPWRVNYYRKESQITYEQLLERIEKWDSSH